MEDREASGAVEAYLPPGGKEEGESWFGLQREGRQFPGRWEGANIW